MAITSIGYPGQIDTVAWAELSGFLGAQYAVAGSADWKPTISTGADRTVLIAPGSGYGDGVKDSSDAEVAIQCPTVSSGSRWDAIVARRNWGTSTTSFVRVAGTSVAVLPNTLEDEPGTLADQPVALVRVQAGQSLLQEVIDLRWFPSKVIRVESLQAIANAPLGTEAVLGDYRYRREIVGGGVATVAWRPVNFGVASVTLSAGATSSTPSGDISYGLPASPNRPVLSFAAESSGAPLLVTINNLGPSSFRVQVHRVDGSPQGSLANIPVHWTAQGR